jgi:hypothetical protein
VTSIPNCVIYDSATGATTIQPIAKQLESLALHGNLLVWIEKEGGPEKPRQTGWMRNIQTMEPATQLFSRDSTLYGGEHLRTNGNVAVWAQAVSIELRGARCYELYKVGLGGSSTPVRLGAGRAARRSTTSRWSRSWSGIVIAAESCIGIS